MTPRGLFVAVLGLLSFAALISSIVELVWIATPFMAVLVWMSAVGLVWCDENADDSHWFDRKLWNRGGGK